MEIIFTTLIALLAGILIGALIAHNKSQALRTRAEVLQAQVENEKKQAQAASSAWQRQVEELKAAAREQATLLKAEAEHRLKEAREEWDQVSRERLAAQEKRFDEAMKMMTTMNSSM